MRRQPQTAGTPLVNLSRVDRSVHTVGRTDPSSLAAMHWNWTAAQAAITTPPPTTNTDGRAGRTTAIPPIRTCAFLPAPPTSIAATSQNGDSPFFNRIRMGSMATTRTESAASRTDLGRRRALNRWRPIALLLDRYERTQGRGSGSRSSILRVNQNSISALSVSNRAACSVWAGTWCQSPGPPGSDTSLRHTEFMGAAAFPPREPDVPTTTRSSRCRGRC